MSETKFKVLSEHLACKISIIRGMNEVIIYDAKETFGIIRIGDTPTDVDCASFVISSVKDGMSVGGHIKLMQGAHKSLTEYLEQLLGAFSFGTRVTQGGRPIDDDKTK